VGGAIDVRRADRVCSPLTSPRLVYQLISGWFFNPTFLGSLLSLLGVPLLGVMGFLAILAASDLCSTGEVGPSAR